MALVINCFFRRFCVLLKLFCCDVNMEIFYTENFACNFGNFLKVFTSILSKTYRKYSLLYSAKMY